MVFVGIFGAFTNPPPPPPLGSYCSRAQSISDIHAPFCLHFGRNSQNISSGRCIFVARAEKKINFDSGLYCYHFVSHAVLFSLLKPTGHVMRQQFNIQQLYALPTQCIYVFCIYLRTNSDLCHLQHKLIGFYNPDEKCLQRGTDWGFI